MSSYGAECSISGSTGMVSTSSRQLTVDVLYSMSETHIPVGLARTER